MKKLSIVLLASALTFAIAPAAQADSFTYTIDGMNFSAELTFTANQIAGQPLGVDVITGVTGWFSDPDTNGIVTISPSNPATVISAGGALAPNYDNNDGFQYDNVLYTNQTGNGILDWGGVVFSIAATISISSPIATTATLGTSILPTMVTTTPIIRSSLVTMDQPQGA